MLCAMQALYPQALLATPGMVSVFVFVLVIEALSLLFLWVASYEFRQLMRRHAQFFEAMRHDDKHERVERTSYVIFWIYVLMTIVVTILTLLLFLFQPHLL